MTAEFTPDQWERAKRIEARLPPFTDEEKRAIRALIRGARHRQQPETRTGENRAA